MICLEKHAKLSKNKLFDGSDFWPDSYLETDEKLPHVFKLFWKVLGSAWPPPGPMDPQTNKKLPNGFGGKIFERLEG